MSTEKRGWVSCKQRLPEPGVLVVAASSQPGVLPYVAKLYRYNKGNKRTWWEIYFHDGYEGDRIEYTDGTFCYWMPLPPLPVEITIEPADVDVRSSAV